MRTGRSVVAAGEPGVEGRLCPILIQLIRSARTIRMRVSGVYDSVMLARVSAFVIALTASVSANGLAAGGESLAAFDGRCIPAGCVAPRSNTPGILGRRALPAGRLARLGATPDFPPGLLALRLHRSIEPVRNHPAVVPPLAGSRGPPPLLILHLLKAGVPAERRAPRLPVQCP